MEYNPTVIYPEIKGEITNEKYNKKLDEIKRELLNNGPLTAEIVV